MTYGPETLFSSFLPCLHPDCSYPGNKQTLKLKRNENKKVLGVNSRSNQFAKNYAAYTGFSLKFPWSLNNSINLSETGQTEYDNSWFRKTKHINWGSGGIQSSKFAWLIISVNLNIKRYKPKCGLTLPLSPQFQVTYHFFVLRGSWRAVCCKFI